MKKTSKKEFVCEQDRVMAAFAKVNIREAVDPIVRGKIVEDEDAYNKVQQLLDCPDMEHAHQFLLDVDFEDLTPETKQKIDDLYQLAVSQGYLDNEKEEEEEEADDEEDDAGFADSEEKLADDLSDNSGGFETVDVPDPAEAASKDSIGMNAPTINTCAFVLFYSAMKNGEIRTGECYSNANTLENAKLDAVQKLEKLGFTAVDIIAAEECDCSAKGCDEQGQTVEFGAQINDPAPTGKEDVELEQVGEAEKVDNEEADNVEKKDDSEEAEKEESEEEEEEEEREFSRSEKIEFFKSYLEEFKKLLQKMKSETYAEMSLADRAKFYDQMTKIWTGKPDPAKFMTPDNVKQIETMKIKLNK